MTMEILVKIGGGFLALLLVAAVVLVPWILGAAAKVKRNLDEGG
jgi:hypothetical protein